MSVGDRLMLGLLAAVIPAGAVWLMVHQADARGYARAQAEARAQLEAWSARNHELQRAAEKRYTVAAEVRERFIVTTVTEVRHATDHLAACPVGPAAVRLLNAAAACARGDSAAACEPGEPVRGAP